MNNYFTDIIKAKKSIDSRYALTLAAVLLTALVSLTLINLDEYVWSAVRPYLQSLRDSINPDSATNAELSEMLTMLYNLVSGAVALLFPAIVLRLVLGKKIDVSCAVNECPVRYHYVPYIIFAIGTGYVVTIAANGIFAWTDVFSNGTDSLGSLPVTVGGIVLYFVYVAILPALCEEYLFRGVIMGALLPYGRNQAIIVSAVIFGMMHVNPIQAIFATAVGLALGKLCADSGSILKGMLIHFAVNMIATAESFILRDNAKNTAILLSIGLFDYAVIGGAIAVGIVLLVKHRRAKRTIDLRGIKSSLYRTVGDALRMLTTRSVWATVLFIAAYVYSLIHRYFV